MRSGPKADDLATEVIAPGRESRAARRRPDVPLPAVERIRPGPGLSRAEVVANQRRRILAGLAAALAYHGYEDTRITDVVELAGISRPTFYEHFESKEACFAAAYADGVERLALAVEGAVREESGWEAGVAAGLRAGLEFLAADPALAHLLLVEALAASRPARLEHERNLTVLAGALRPPPGEPAGGEPISAEAARLLAGGLASHLNGRLLAGEAERLPESHGLLLGYLLTPALSAVPLPASGAARG